VNGDSIPWILDGMKAAALRERLAHLEGFQVTTLDWSTGLIICVRQRS
jgi:hypothetical protein